MEATETYNPGEELHENYGWTNHAYFLSHGFILDNHPEDKLHLPALPLPLEDEQRAFLLASVLETGWEYISPTYSPVVGREVSRADIAVMHIIKMSDMAVQRLMTSLVDHEDENTTKSQAARKMLFDLDAPALSVVWTALTSQVRDLVDGFARASLEEDEAIVVGEATGGGRPGLRPNQLRAIQFRLSQRKLARDLMERYQEEASVWR